MDDFMHAISVRSLTVQAVVAARFPVPKRALLLALQAPLQRLDILLGPIRRPRPVVPIAPAVRRRRRALPSKTRTFPVPISLDRLERSSAYVEDEGTLEPHSEAAACRTLLLEILRRAAYDWVLYRHSRKLPHRQLAEDAYHWLFVEPADYEVRRTQGKDLTSFLSICEILDLRPEEVRTRVRQLTERDIMGAGRPAERRKARQDDVQGVSAHAVMDVDVDLLPTHDPMFALGD